MKPPRGALTNSNTSAASVARTPTRFYAKWRGERRAAWAQCEQCGEKATVKINPRGKLDSEGMRITYGRHRPCGGRIELYDITESKDQRNHAA